MIFWKLLILGPRTILSNDSSQIGRAMVLSVEPRSAVVEVKLDKPSGDGLAREGDLVQVYARVPKMETRSRLWSLARFHIELLDLKNQDSFFDYRMLYAKETPDLVNGIYEKMLAEIHEVADQMGGGAGQNKPFTKGTFAGKDLRQAIESSTHANLDRFLDFLRDHASYFAGQSPKLTDTYSLWVEKVAVAE